MRTCHHEPAIIDHTGLRVYDDRMKNEQAKTHTSSSFFCSRAVASVAGTSNHFSSSQNNLFLRQLYTIVSIGEKNTSTFFIKLAGIASLDRYEII